MEKYSSYKDSGFAWMGQIPSHWETRRFRFLLAENSLQNTDLKERKQLQFKYGDIVPKANQSEDKDVLDTIKKYTVVAPGDIMINGLNLNYDFISQRVAQVQEPGVITSAYVSLRPLEGANSKYYTYYMKAMDAQKMFHGMGSGVRLTLSYDNLKNLFFPYPSPEEQDAMVAYLDAATAKIDEAIAQQRQMIELLDERKQIIFNQTVTKGLYSNAKMKDSGIDWIGGIPVRWSVDKLKLYYTFEKGKNAQLYTNEYVGKNPGAYPVYSGQTENDGIMGFIDSFDYDVDECLFTTTVGAKVMTPKILRGKFSLSQNCLIMKRSREIVNDYVYYFLLSMFPHKKALIPSHMQPSLRVEDMKTYKVLVPSIEEQYRIADYLNFQCLAINNVIEASNDLISLLQERKQIIINDVVTGKVKV